MREASQGQWCGVVLVFFGISFDKLGKSKKSKTESCVC